MTSINRPRRLVLIRHGESQRNKAKKGATYFADEAAREQIRGVPDHKIPLTDLGHRQARQTGVALARLLEAPDYFYHSGYRRTRETLDGVLSGYPEDVRRGVQIRENMFIRERDSGYAYDMMEEEAEAAFPWLKEYWATHGGFLARPAGGESLADVTTRVHTFLNTIFRDRAGQNVFVATHGGTLRCFRYLLERWDYERAAHWPPGQSPKNCGVTIYEYDASVGRLVLREYNTVYCEEEKE